MNKPALIVHGGAWHIAEAEHAAHLDGVAAAAQAAWAILSRGGTALDAIEQAITMMEDDPTFDAGVGSVLNSIGEVQMDASIMDGSNLRMGAIAAVQGVQHPIHLARLVMLETEHNMLVGQGARHFAMLHGEKMVPQIDLITAREAERFRQYQENPPASASESFSGLGWDKLHSGGTVGAVAMDTQGNIAAGTSTGGTPYSLPGRVGDSPLVGCGTFADNETGGASCTGHGERIMQVVLAKHATDLIRNGRSAAQAASESIAYMQQRVEGYGGIILIDKDGQPGFAHNTPHMAAAWYDSSGQLHRYIKPG